jgi:hypothetical protein
MRTPCDDDNNAGDSTFPTWCTVLDFGQNSALEETLGSHDCWFEGKMRVIQWRASRLSTFSYQLSP